LLVFGKGIQSESQLPQQIQEQPNLEPLATL